MIKAMTKTSPKAIESETQFASGKCLHTQHMPETFSAEVSGELKILKIRYLTAGKNR
jgi:hypothetical protein